MRQGPVIIVESCGCMVDHGIPHRCPEHQLRENNTMSFDCPKFCPDHNGECLNCDDWADAHTEEALKDYDTTIARMAGNIAGNMVEDQQALEKPEVREWIARHTVALVRAIVAEVKRTEPKDAA